MIFWVKKHKFLTFIAVILILLATRFIFTGKDDSEETNASAKKVQLTSITALQDLGSELPLVGTLESNEQVELRTQIPGIVSNVGVVVGQAVFPGQVLVEVEHRDLDASVQQAFASLQSALAQLDKLKNGARPEELTQTENSVQQAQNSLDDALINYELVKQQNKLSLDSVTENSALGILNAQITVDSIIFEDLDNLFDRNDGDSFIPVTESTLTLNEVNQRRDDLNKSLQLWKDSTVNITSKDVGSVQDSLGRSKQELMTVLTFLQSVNSALVDTVATPSFTETDITIAEATINASRSTIQSLIDAMISYEQAILSQLNSNAQRIEAARTQIDNAQINLSNTQQQLNVAQTGARSEDIRLQEAAVSQAQANLALASANRDKAIIRAPFAGTVTYLPVDLGDFISSSNIAVSLANETGLEVTTFVSEQERQFVNIGNNVLINGLYDGVVSEIAPALDPVRKKIEVKITVLSVNPNLTLGETVNLRVKRTETQSQTVRLPLSAVKLTSDGSFVYIVNQSSEIEAKEVEVIDVTGSSIEIFADLDGVTEFINDIRGLTPGQKVEV